MLQPLEPNAGDEASFALTLMTSRQNILPKRLVQPGPSAAQVNAMFRAPFLALAIARLGSCEPDINPLERMVSVGAAAFQNFLLMAHGMSFGRSLTSGQAMRSAPLRQLFQLIEGEQAVCCINVGTVAKCKPMRLRPNVSAFVSRCCEARSKACKIP